MDTVTCSNCQKEKIPRYILQTRCGHPICTNCFSRNIVASCGICGIGVAELLEIPELSGFKDSHGDLLYDLLWYQSVSKAYKEESENDNNIYKLCSRALSSVFSTMVLEEEEEEEEEEDKEYEEEILEECLEEIKNLLDSKYSKLGPKPARR